MSDGLRRGDRAVPVVEPEGRVDGLIAGGFEIDVVLGIGDLERTR